MRSLENTFLDISTLDVKYHIGILMSEIFYNKNFQADRLDKMII